MAVRPPPAALAARFRIERPFTEGATGALYFATEQATGKNGLLKVVYAAKDVTPSERARLVRELEKLGSLNHPGLATPTLTGLEGETPWLFRENIGGESLATRLSRGALPQPDALAIAAQLAAALDELHRAGLLQRDLSPSHILLREGTTPPRAVLIDSGIAARIAAGALFEVTGKPPYVSPEHASGKLVSFRSDLYSLGCVLFEMLAGVPAFSGDTASTLEAQRTGAPPTLPVQAPSSVTSLLNQLLSKDPRERPFSAQQVRRALEPYLPAGAVGAAPAASPKRTLLGIPSPVGKRADQTEELSAMDLSRAEAALRPAPPRADATMPLTPMDLARAEQVLQRPPRFDATMPLGAQDLQPALVGKRSVPPPPPGATSPGLVVPPAPRAPSVRPPPPPASRPPAAAAAGDLDYDDLAETIARERAPEDDAAFAAAAPATAPTAAMAQQNFEASHGAIPSSGSGFPPATSGGFPPTGTGFPAASAGFGSAPTAHAFPAQTPPQHGQTAPQQGAYAPQVVARPADDLDTLPVRRVPPALLWIGAVAAFCLVASGSGALVSYMLHSETGAPVVPVMPAPAVAGVVPTVGNVGSGAPLRPGNGPAPIMVPTHPPIPPLPEVIPPPAPIALPAPVEPAPVEPIPVDPAPVVAPPVITPVVTPAPPAAPPPAATGSSSGAARSGSGSSSGGASARSSSSSGGSSGSSGGSSGSATGSSSGSSSGASGGSSSSSSGGGRLSSRIGGGSSSGSSSGAATSGSSGGAAAGSSGGAAAAGSSGGSAASGSSGGGSSGASFDDLRARARAAFGARRFGEAAEAYEAAARLQPRNASVWAGLGAARLADGNARGAVEAYERAVAITPGSAAFHAALGRALATAGDRGRARSEYDAALRIDPDNRDATIGLTRL